jgi:hypothetical protein
MVPPCRLAAYPSHEVRAGAIRKLHVAHDEIRPRHSDLTLSFFNVDRWHHVRANRSQHDRQEVAGVSVILDEEDRSASRLGAVDV